MRFMQISKDALKLVEDSPFKQFVLMEMERERLYQSFVLVDEFNEISSSWLEFSDFCAKSLFNVSSLANLLYQRYLDEYTRDKEQIESDKKRKTHVIERIEGLQQFQMESAILMILYSDIVNTGVFSSKPAQEYCTVKIEGFKILDRISTTYFDSAHPRASSIEDIMLTFFLLNQKKQLLDVLQEAPQRNGKNDYFLREKALHHQSLAKFETSFISSLVKKIGLTWWWYDPIAIHFSYERALEHLDNAVEIYSKLEQEIENKEEQLKKEDITINKAWKNQALVDHFFRLTLEAAKQDSFMACIEYQNLCLGLSKEMKDFLSSLPNLREKEQKLLDEIENYLTKFNFIRNVSELAAKTISLITTEKNEEQLFQDKIQDIENLLDKTNIYAEYYQLNDLPFIYQNFIQQIKISLLEGLKPQNAIQDALLIFKKYINRLELLVDKIAKEIHLHKTKKSGSKNKLNQFIEEVLNIKYVTYFLPKIEEKIDLIKEVETLEFFTHSIETLERLDISKINEIENLIYHAKAHYHSTKALEIAQRRRKEIVPEEWIKQQYSKTFLAGREVELKLFELTRQYLFLNTVIDEVAKGYKLAINSKKLTKENYVNNLSHSFNYFELFEIINKQINQNCSETLKHQEQNVSRRMTLNKDIIEIKRKLSDTVDTLINATKEGIIGYAADRYKDSYKAAVRFNNSQKSALKASEIIETMTNIDNSFSQLAKSAYEYGLFFKELERKTRENRELQQLPLQKILSMLKQIIFFS